MQVKSQLYIQMNELYNRICILQLCFASIIAHRLFIQTLSSLSFLETAHLRGMNKQSLYYAELECLIGHGLKHSFWISKIHFQQFNM